MILICKTLSPFYQRMLYAKIGLNWPISSGKKNLIYFVNIFSVFRDYLPLKKDMALPLNKLESSSPKDALCQVWLKLASLLWGKNFFFTSLPMYLHFFVIISPWKMAWPFISTNLNPLYQRGFV